MRQRIKNTLKFLSSDKVVALIEISVAIVGLCRAVEKFSKTDKKIGFKK